MGAQSKIVYIVDGQVGDDVSENFRWQGEEKGTKTFAVTEPSAMFRVCVHASYAVSASCCSTGTLD